MTSANRKLIGVRETATRVYDLVTSMVAFAPLGHSTGASKPAFLKFESYQAALSRGPGVNDGLVIESNPWRP